MARLYHVFSAILLWGIVQADVIRYNEPAFIEDLRGSSSSRIVGGWPAKKGQFPYQISLRMVTVDGYVSSCGGSIIHHEWVITAAHCVANRPNFVIRLGVLNLTRPAYIVETSRWFTPPEYDATMPTRAQTADIALLALEHSIPYGPTIQPVRIQNSQQKDINYKGVVLTVSGFGLTDNSWDGGEASEILRWTYLRGITIEECRSWYTSSTAIQEQTVCAEYYNDTSQASCQGDSGGPLTKIDVDGKPTMIGLVSFGSIWGCNSPYPTAYARPGWYHAWFTEVTGINFDWKNEDLVPIDPADVDEVKVINL